jgi:hypothetical protein
MRFDQIPRRSLPEPGQKDHSQSKLSRQFYSGLLSTPSDKLFWNRREQTCTVTASTICIHTSTVREAF